MVNKEPYVFVALPSRPGDAIAMGLLTATHNVGNVKVYGFVARPCSLLTTNFNQLWCDALNARDKGITDFCMVHADIVPEPGWLEMMVKERRRVGADVLSISIAIKDDAGDSSAGVMDWKTKRMKKFSIKETLLLPKSFTAEDAGYPGHALLMNTGLWICDITKPWAEMICFRQKDTIVRQTDGKFKPAAVSEDWLFSLDCARLNLKCYVSTAVKANHQGVYQYPNFVAWGSEGRHSKDSDGAIAWNIEPPESWGVTKKATA